MDSGILNNRALGMMQFGGGGGVYSATRDQIGVGRVWTTWIISLRESGNSEGRKSGISFSFTFLFQEEQHRSHENCLDAASDDLLDLQRNLPERRGRSRELEEYRLRKEYLEHEVSSLLSSGSGETVSQPHDLLQMWREVNQETQDSLNRCFFSKGEL